MESFPVGDVTMCQSACLFVSRHFGRFFPLFFKRLPLCQCAVFCHFRSLLLGVAVVLWPLSYLFPAGFRLFLGPLRPAGLGPGWGWGFCSAFRRPFRRVGFPCAGGRFALGVVTRTTSPCREAEPSGTLHRHEHHTSITRASHGQPHQIYHRNKNIISVLAPPLPPPASIPTGVNLTPRRGGRGGRGGHTSPRSHL